MDIGDKFNSWTLFAEAAPKKTTSKRTGKIGYRNTHGIFKCTCGGKAEVQKHSVQSGRSRMCVDCSYLLKVEQYGIKHYKRGDKIEKWTFIEYSKAPFLHTSLVRCECGVKKEVRTSNLKRGYSRSCPNCAARKPFPLKKGDKIGRWTFLREAKPVLDQDGQTRKCGTFVCECGTRSTQRINLFTGGKTDSCHRCCRKEYPNSHKLLWKIFRDMMGKCYNHNHEAFHKHGDVNVGVFRKWRADFMLFQDWAFVNGYKEGLVITRIKNYKSFTPANCEWITKEEAKLKRSTVMVIFKDEVFTLYEVLKSLGLYNQSKFNMCARRIKKNVPFNDTMREVFPDYRGQYFK